MKERAKRKKCKVRFSLTKKHKVFEVAENGSGASESVESACSEDGKRRQQRVKRGQPRCPFFMEAFGLVVEEEFSTIATQTWTEGVWAGRWCTEEKEAWMVQTWRQVREPAGGHV